MAKISKEEQARRERSVTEMKNTLSDLNNYLFEAIERINDDDLSDEELDKEIKRSESVNKIAKTIIDNGNLALQAKKHLDEYGRGEDVEMPMLGITNKWISEENKELEQTVKNLQKRVKKMEDW